MSRNICISTWYQSYNYGTGLQAIALFLFLEDKGYKCYFLEDNRDKKENKQEVKKIDKFLKSFVNGKVFSKFLYHKSFKEKNDFQVQYMKKVNRVETINNSEDIEKLNKKFNTFIIGGDQVLNPYYLEEKHLLTFVDDDKKMLSYGSSVGVKEIPNELQIKYKKYLGRLENISVREVMSAEALDFLNKPIEVVLDPTMILTENQWNKFIKDAEIDPSLKKKKYILCYFVGDRHSYWKYVEKIEQKTEYDVVVIPLNYNLGNKSYLKYYKTSPKEFIWLIKNAEIVCTDSFHATVFSIIFQREFYTVKRFLDTSGASQNGRIVNLLDRFDLSNRLIDDETIFKRINITNYNEVSQKLKQEREDSIQWLMNALR